MNIKKSINNKVEGFTIIDDKGEYFIEGKDEKLALDKYNAIKLVEANPPQPSYQELRLKEYPSLQDQLDVKYWDSINGTHKWEELITSIKEKYPKG